MKELLPQNLWASSRFFFRTVAVRDESGQQEERWREVIKDDSEVSVFGKVQNIEIQKCPNKKYNKLKSRKIQNYKEDESQASLLEKARTLNLSNQFKSEYQSRSKNCIS